MAATTRAYREAIDLGMAGLPNEIEPSEKDDLEQIYSRGLGPHFMSGVNHQNVVVGRAPRHRGLKVGSVLSVERNSVVVFTERPIKPGDGIVFDAADWRSPDEPEEGGNVYEVKDVSRDNVRLKFGHGEIDFSRIRVGDLVWRTSDPQLKKRLKSLTASNKPVSTHGVRFEVSALPGQLLSIVATTETGEVATCQSDEAVEAAHKRALDLETLEGKLGRLGGTPFHLTSVEFDQPDNGAGSFVPTSLLNAARRELVEKLLTARIERDPSPVGRLSESFKNTPTTVGRLSESSSLQKNDSESRPTLLDPNQVDSNSRPTIGLHVLVRSQEQLEAAIEMAPTSITLDYLAAKLLNSGVDTITPTYDLNSQQIEELSRTVDSTKFEVIAYSHLPVFHTEHCVFCRFLSDGTDNTNCGHPCEKHKIAVRDAAGRAHPVMADVGCRNTVFGAEAQTDVEAMARWIEAGICNFRLEFVHETPSQVADITSAFQVTLKNGLQSPEAVNQLKQQLQSLAPQDITQGSLFVPKDFKNLVQLS